MQKGFGVIYILMAILVLGLIVGGAYYLGKSSSIPQPLSLPPTSTLPIKVDKNAPTDQTADWKTYMGDQFSINYPSSYVYNKVSAVTSPEYPTIDSTIEFTDKGRYFDFTITVAKNYENLTLDTALGKGPSLRYISNLLPEGNSSKITLGGTPAVMGHDILGGQSGNIAFDVITIKNGRVYQVSSSVNDKNEFNQILSTFKFTN